MTSSEATIHDESAVDQDLKSSPQTEEQSRLTEVDERKLL